MYFESYSVTTKYCFCKHWAWRISWQTLTHYMKETAIGRTVSLEVRQPHVPFLHSPAYGLLKCNHSLRKIHIFFLAVHQVVGILLVWVFVGL